MQIRRTLARAFAVAAISSMVGGGGSFAADEATSGKRSESSETYESPLLSLLLLPVTLLIQMASALEPEKSERQTSSGESSER